jgi:hydrogenase maturation protease
LTPNALASQRILIVGVGNVLHGDDGFGVELAWRLAKRDLGPGVKVMETGIGGMSIVQELMLGYDAVLLLDAHQGGGQPGEVRLLQPELPDLSKLDMHALRDYFADTHYATPTRALKLLEQLGRLPPRVAIIGCEPVDANTMGLGLSKEVALALEPAERLALEWLIRFGDAHPGSGASMGA